MQAAEHTLCKLVILLCDDFYSDFTFILKKFLYFSIIDELTVDRDRKYKEKTCNKGSFQLVIVYSIYTITTVPSDLSQSKHHVLSQIEGFFFNSPASHCAEKRTITEL